MSVAHHRLLPNAPFQNIRAESRAAVDRLAQDIVHFRRGDVMIRAVNGVNAAYLVVDGWAMRFKHLADGRRQVLDFAVPGDVIGFVGMFTPVADWSSIALTDAAAVVLNRAAVLDLRRNAPDVFEKLIWNAMRSFALLTEHVVRFGPKNVAERIAHLVLELLARLEAVGVADNDRLQWPVTQDMMADMLGVSSVHMNRTIRQLEDDGLIAYERASIQVLNRDGLKEMADFDGAYLSGPALPEDTHQTQ